MLPKTKDGEVDTYLLGAPIAIGAILCVIAMVVMMWRCTPAPQGTEEKKAAEQSQKAGAGAPATTPAAKGAH